jgi:hypothetical protein
VTTQRDIALDDTHDFYLDASGDIAIAEDIDALETDIEVTLRADRGQWAFDQTYGAPWRGEIFRKAPDVPRISATLKAVVASIPKVNRIIQWEDSFDSRARTLTIDGALDTDYGPLPLSYSLG